MPLCERQAFRSRSNSMLKKYLAQRNELLHAEFLCVDRLAHAGRRARKPHVCVPWENQPLASQRRSLTSWKEQ